MFDLYAYLQSMTKVIRKSANLTKFAILTDVFSTLNEAVKVAIIFSENFPLELKIFFPEQYKQSLLVL